MHAPRPPPPPPPPPPACARCRFGPVAAWGAAPTYAFVLGLGADVRAAGAEADAWAAGHVETSETAFCGACACVCWLARDACPQAALLTHAARLRRVQALHRQAARGAGGDSATEPCPDARHAAP